MSEFPEINKEAQKILMTHLGIPKHFQALLMYTGPIVHELSNDFKSYKNLMIDLKKTMSPHHISECEPTSYICPININVLRNSF